MLRMDSGDPVETKRFTLRGEKGGSICAVHVSSNWRLWAPSNPSSVKAALHAANVNCRAGLVDFSYLVRLVSQL